jgi:NitT/TauT family transport system permease protein
MLIFFGVSLAGQVVLIALVAFSPVVINTALGASSVDPLLLRAARMLGASRFQTLLRVVVPASLPSIFAGLRLALAFSWVALVIAELAGATSGIGYTLYQAYYFDRPDIMLADMITVGALGVLSDRVLRLVAKQITHT